MRPLPRVYALTVIGSAKEMWFAASSTGPVRGMFSPPRQIGLVQAMITGQMMSIAMPNQKPRPRLGVRSSRNNRPNSARGARSSGIRVLSDRRLSTLRVRRDRVPGSPAALRRRTRFLREVTGLP